MRSVTATGFSHSNAHDWVWNGVLSLRIEFFSGEPEVRSDGSSEHVVVAVDDVEIELTRAAASSLADDIGDALVTDREFFRTAGTHRPDGSYEVRRRGADSSGNAKVFADFAAVERLFERLPATFDADDVGRTGITGSRRHMLVRHFAEHPAFDCEIDSRSPLEAVKTTAKTATADEGTAATDDEETAATDAGTQPVDGARTSGEIEAD
jgi:hypothetical protein